MMSNRASETDRNPVDWEDTSDSSHQTYPAAPWKTILIWICLVYQRVTLGAEEKEEKKEEGEWGISSPYKSTRCLCLETRAHTYLQCLRGH